METIQQLEAYQRVKTRIVQLQQKGRTSEAQKLVAVLAEIESRKKVMVEPSNSGPYHNPGLEEVTTLLRETLQEIKFLVEIQAKPSLTYEKIMHDAVRKALRRDNLRMEQALFNVTITDTEQFHSFCNNAFRQVENLLNYYYFKKFPEQKSWLKHFLDLETIFQEGKLPQKLSQVPAHNKLYCFEKVHYHDSEKKVYYDSKLDLIRRVRNLDAHRCDVYLQEYDHHHAAYEKLLEKIEGFKKNGLSYPKDNKDRQIEKEGKLAEFIKAQNFDLIRQELKGLYRDVVEFL